MININQFHSIITTANILYFTGLIQILLTPPVKLDLILKNVIKKYLNNIFI